MPIEPALQESVDRFVRSLKSPRNLIDLHPRKRGHPGKAAALSPAIVLSVVSAFEGFAEDLVAITMHQSERSFAQIARRVGNWNNPTLDDLTKVLQKEFAGILVPSNRYFEIWEPPRLGGKTSIWNSQLLTWDETISHADGWMQVRHCLTHGLATGLGSESWSGPLRGTTGAQFVLRPMKDNKHSLTLHGAISCARIYTWGAMHVADAAASYLGQTIDWSRIPDFHV